MEPYNKVFSFKFLTSTIQRTLLLNITWKSNKVLKGCDMFVKCKHRFLGFLFRILLKSSVKKGQESRVVFVFIKRKRV